MTIIKDTEFRRLLYKYEIDIGVPDLVDILGYEYNMCYRIWNGLRRIPLNLIDKIASRFASEIPREEVRRAIILDFVDQEVEDYIRYIEDLALIN